MTTPTRTLDTGTDHLVGEVHGPVAVLAFNRPERRNALSEEMYRGFATALPIVAHDPDIRVLLLTGRGGAFCAGGDVKGFDERNRAAAAGAPGPSPEQGIASLRERQRQVSLALHQLPKPVVAALPGPAAGAGLSIALAADIRLAAERALLVTAFADIGASGDFGGSWFLTQLVGPALAKELYFTSPRLTAAEARQIGLVNRVLPDDGFDEAALAWCQDLAARAPIALRHIKENVNRALTCDLGTALDAEAVAMNRTMSTADHREAASAFVEKRKATFTGN